MDTFIPAISLVIAALAVFFGPVISWKITEKQIRASSQISNKQIIGPMRQAWINKLRDLIAEITSSSLFYWQVGFEERKNKDYHRLVFLEHQIGLFLNPEEKDHQLLEKLIKKMLRALERGAEGDNEFLKAHMEITRLSRTILKKEWNRVKEEIEI